MINVQRKVIMAETNIRESKISARLVRGRAAETHVRTPKYDNHTWNCDRKRKAGAHPPSSGDEVESNVKKSTVTNVTGSAPASVG